MQGWFHFILVVKILGNYHSTTIQIVIPPTLLSPNTSSLSRTNNLTDSDGSSEEITLFDWISSKDPAYSLNSLSQHVIDHLEKTNDSDLRDAQKLFALVQDVAKKSQYILKILERVVL